MRQITTALVGLYSVYRRVVARVTTDFFEAELSATSSARQATTHWLAKAGDIPSVAEVTSGPDAPFAASYSPGAACLDGHAHRQSAGFTNPPEGWDTDLVFNTSTFETGPTLARRRRSESFLTGSNNTVAVSASK